MIFIDTTFWVGDADANDDFYQSSRPLIEALRLGTTPMALTTDFVLDETVTILGSRKGFGATKAVRAAESILQSPRVFTVFIDEQLFWESLKVYPNYKGKLSVTDVSSLAVMERYSVGTIYSHDHDFDGLEGIKRKESL